MKTGVQEMIANFRTRAWRLAGEAVLQTVPPSLLSAYAADRLAATTGITFLQSAGFVGLGLLALMILAMPVE